VTRLQCLLGRHRWNGCTCSACGMTRDESHAWKDCICAACGKRRDHAWSGCKCDNCGYVRDSDHVWSGCVCSLCGKTKEHTWKGKICDTCGAEWTRPDTVWEIDRSSCGFFVETQLRDWARGQHRTSNGARETLAASLGIERFSVREIIDKLMLPVIRTHHEQVLERTTEPAQVGSPLIDAQAWLATGAQCQLDSTSNVAPLFVMYYALVHLNGDTRDFLFTAIADEINRRRGTFTGNLWTSYTPHDIILSFVRDPEPGRFLADLMNAALLQPLRSIRSASATT
jgi:hypothetical protein